MPEAVVATSSNENPIAQPGNAHLPSRDNSIDRVFAELNAKHGGDPNEFKSLGEITDAVTGESSSTKKDSHETPSVSREKSPQVEAPKPDATAEKTRIKVRDKDGAEKEYELSAEQLKAFAQKGVYYEKKGVEIAKFDQALQEREAKVADLENREKIFLETLEKDPGAVLEYLFGEEAFDKIKPWATGKVQKLQEYEQNPHQKALDDANRRAEALQGQLEQRQKQEASSAEQQNTQKFVQHYTKVITGALEIAGVPKTNFSASEAAKQLEIASQRGVDLKPEQLAEILKEHQTMRVRAMTGGLAQAILDAKKANDSDAVVKCGEQLAAMLGEDVVYGLAKYHLAKIQKTQPLQPKPILESPRVIKPADKRRGYMSEDEYAKQRRERAAAIDRGENVGDW